MVDLAATVGAQKAEDLAAFDAQADMVDGGEIVETHGQTVGLDGDLLRAAVGTRRNHDVLVAPALLLRKQLDKSRFQGIGAGACA